MTFFEKLKRYFGLDDEYSDCSNHGSELELAQHKAREYKRLALLKNQESIAKSRLIDELRTRIDFLEKVNQCQAELLAEREV